MACLKSSRLLGSKDIVPRKRKIKYQGLAANDAQNENKQIAIENKWSMKRSRTLMMYDLEMRYKTLKRSMNLEIMRFMLI